MLNRNDRIALRRNRNAVTWLITLCLLLGFWIKMLYSDIDTLSYNRAINTQELKDAQKICIDRRKTIDSLTSVINYKQVDTPKVVKTYKPIKKDSLITKAKVDTSKSESKDIILKDTIR